MAKDTFYFTHDYNTRNDEKIKALLFKHGLLGYGVFWAIIEDLYNNANALQLDCERIAFELRSDKIIVESVIKDFGLFTFEGSIFGSHSVQKRLEDRLSKSTKARQSAFKRWNKDSIDANALPPQSEGNAIKESKVEEIKESKEITIVEQNEILPPKKSNVRIKDRLKRFQDRLKIHVPTYGKEMIRAFYDYWTEKSEDAVKMRFEYQKSFEITRRLQTWQRNEKNFNNNNKNGKSTIELNRDVAREAIAKLEGNNSIPRVD